MKYVLGIDLGTSGTKTVLFDQYGTAVCSALVEYPLYQPHNGWAEQKPEDWYHAAVDTIRSVLTKSGVDKKDVVSMGISGQMHGLVMLDEAGNVLRPSIIWCDQRTAAECDQIHEIVGRDQLIAITANPALTGFTLSKLLWVRNHEPEVYAKCRHILLPKDYVRYMLTGDFATEVSDASGMQMLDVPNRCWSDEVLEKLYSLANSSVMLGELQELLRYQYNNIDFIDSTTDLGFECPLDVHCTYTQRQLLAALDYKNFSAMRQGVLYLPEKKIDVFLITLNKSDKDYSPTTMYEDYAISPSLFHWQSQSTTASDSPTGRRYIHHAAQGGRILLFVREFKQDALGTSPYTFLGKATYVSHTGSKPMNIVWKLEKPIPAKYLRRVQQVMG